MKDWLIKVLKNWLIKLDPSVFEFEEIINEVIEPPVDPPVEPEPEPVPEPEPAISKEDYWNNKWEKEPIIYNGRILKKDTNIYVQSPLLQTPVDVRAFILDNDELMQKTLREYDLVKKTWDETMLAIQYFVVFGFHWSGVPFLTYVNDLDENETYEFWQFPFETICSHKGDCEDGAILIASLAINAGIPAYRVKVAAGFVSNKEYIEKYNLSKDILSEGGHAYCIYLASDDEWRVIDWCYYNDANVRMLSKPLAKNGGYENCYKDTWFTFNSQFSWNQTALDIEVNRISEITEKEELNPATQSQE